MNTLPRGLRNNNPGNIKEFKWDKTHWLGERATDDDPIMEEFVLMWYGVRAARKVFQNYQKKYDLNSIRQLIERWAPPEENDTGSYVKAVCYRCGRDPDEYVDTTDLEFMKDFLRAVFRHENGPLADTYVTDDDMARGLTTP